jgi:5-methyltetrahydropteroyltriglutamate--homocysteine methyltransferase
MKRSEERILVTHQGTLPRAADLRDMVVAREEGKPFDESTLSEGIRSAVKDLVRKQVDTGIDLVNDGEQSKSGFQYYARVRLSGHEERPSTPGGPPPRNTSARDRRDYPGFFSRGGSGAYSRRQSFVTSPLEYIGQEAVKTDIANLKAAIAGAPVADGSGSRDDRALAPQRVLAEPVRFPDRRRRCDARRVQGDHRRGPDRPHRRS